MAVAKAVTSGVVMVAPASNEGLNGGACCSSLEAEALAITVVATNHMAGLWNWSNYGQCVDICAPGEGIYAATSTGKRAYGLEGWDKHGLPWLVFIFSCREVSSVHHCALFRV